MIKTFVMYQFVMEIDKYSHTHRYLTPKAIYTDKVFRHKCKIALVQNGFLRTVVKLVRGIVTSPNLTLAFSVCNSA
jgi:hypothetical protein